MSNAQRQAEEAEKVRKGLQEHATSTELQEFIEYLADVNAAFSALYIEGKRPGLPDTLIGRKLVAVFMLYDKLESRTGFANATTILIALLPYLFS